MKALSIRQPHAEAIIRGMKPIEFRSRPTKLRERIYIYASQGRYRAEEESEILKSCGMEGLTCDDLPRGVLIGTVELWDCTGSGRKYEWYFRNPERAVELLKPTKHPQAQWFNPF
jgi:hypothetical protein